MAENQGGNHRSWLALRSGGFLTSRMEERKQILQRRTKGRKWSVMHPEESCLGCPLAETLSPPQSSSDGHLAQTELCCPAPLLPQGPSVRARTPSCGHLCAFPSLPLELELCCLGRFKKSEVSSYLICHNSVSFFKVFSRQNKESTGHPVLSRQLCTGH